VQSVIVVDEKHKTRNIFFDVNRPIGAHQKLPSEEVILSARVLFVDIYGMQGMIRAARIARAAGIPVVGDFERSDVPRFRQLMRLVDHLILPNDFACQFAGAKHPAAAAEQLWTAFSQAHARERVVIVTVVGGMLLFS
jgi:sugar/nucleoside kinase (ribokinase family)